MIYFGVDIGGTGIKVGAVSSEGKILYMDSTPTQAQMGYEVLAKDIAELINKIMAENNIDLSEVAAVGMGCPGSIDDKNGVVIYANNLNMTNAPLCDELRKYIDKPIYIGNDANCAALGEYFALNDSSVEHMIAITLGTGVGGGIILNKKIFTGFNGVAGELGHSTLIMDGEQCSCGRKGCWEAYASVTALNRDALRAALSAPDSLLAKEIEANSGKPNGKIIFGCANRGDETALAVVDQYAKYVAQGIVDLINIFRPQYIVVGGGVSAQGDCLLNPIKKYVGEATYGGDLIKKTDIRIAKLGNDAGIIGAALQAL